MFVLRSAAPADAPEVLPRTQALNAHEGIVISAEALEKALRHLLATPDLGGAWLIASDQVTVGYAIVTYGYDLEFGGRDAYLTELWVDEPWRNRGAGRAALELLPDELRTRGVRALHLQVRPDNPAVRLYDRLGFVRSPRQIMTRRLT